MSQLEINHVIHEPTAKNNTDVDHHSYVNKTKFIQQFFQINQHLNHESFSKNLLTCNVLGNLKSEVKDDLP